MSGWPNGSSIEVSENLGLKGEELAAFASQQQVIERKEHQREHEEHQHERKEDKCREEARQNTKKHRNRDKSCLLHCLAAASVDKSPHSKCFVDR